VGYIILKGGSFMKSPLKLWKKYSYLGVDFGVETFVQEEVFMIM